jgi:SMODS and SLOG-associating 2TM effector domain
MDPHGDFKTPSVDHPEASDSIEAIRNPPKQQSDPSDPDPEIGLLTFRILLGIPAGDATDSLPNPLTNGTSAPKATIVRPGRYAWLFGPKSKPKVSDAEAYAEYDSSVYVSVCNEENKMSTYYHLFDFLVYASLIFQLIISAVLVLLGALNGNYHIPVAVLGSVNGVITGVLSLMRGQGLPKRFVSYRNALRKVREEIEFGERQMRTPGGKVRMKMSAATALQKAWEQAQADFEANRPDTWQTGSPVLPTIVPVQGTDGLWVMQPRIDPNTKFAATR